MIIIMMVLSRTQEVDSTDSINQNVLPYLDNRTKYKFTQYDGHHPDPQVMDDKKMLHLAKSSTVSVRFQPEILNGNLSILYVVSPFTIIVNSFIHNNPQRIPFNLHLVSKTFTIILMKIQCLQCYEGAF